MKKLIAYGQNLEKYLQSGKKPNNDVYCFMGLNAWKKAKYFNQRRFTLCLPPYTDPKN